MMIYQISAFKRPQTLPKWIKNDDYEVKNLQILFAFSNLIIRPFLSSKICRFLSDCFQLLTMHFKQMS